MNDVVKGWNVPFVCSLYFTPLLWSLTGKDSGKDLQLPSTIPACDRNTNQRALVKDFPYHWVVEPDDRGPLFCP